MANDGDTLDVLIRLKPNAIVLVADAGLGTINAVRLCIDALTSQCETPSPPRSENGHQTNPIPPIPPIFVVLNRFDEGNDLHRRNRIWLADRLGLMCLLSHESLEPIFRHISSVGF